MKAPNHPKTSGLTGPEERTNHHYVERKSSITTDHRHLKDIKRIIITETFKGY